jgi:hypothetical protein
MCIRIRIGISLPEQQEQTIKFLEIGCELFNYLVKDRCWDCKGGNSIRRIDYSRNPSFTWATG